MEKVVSSSTLSGWILDVELAKIKFPILITASSLSISIALRHYTYMITTLNDCFNNISQWSRIVQVACLFHGGSSRFSPPPSLDYIVFQFDHAFTRALNIFVP